MSVRHLVRKLDLDLVARVLAHQRDAGAAALGADGGRVAPGSQHHRPLKHVKPPRETRTYRAARRNALKELKRDFKKM